MSNKHHHKRFASYVGGFAAFAAEPLRRPTMWLLLLARAANSGCACLEGKNPMGRKENYQRRNAEIGKMKIVQKIIKKVRERRAKKYSALFENFVPFGSTVLDIGAGRGFIAKNISKKRKAKITLLDVIDFNQINLPFVLYDGKTIPFAAHSFDISLLISVLHHCDKPERILGEAIRVSKSRVIIFEELYENFWQKKLQSFLDILFNLFQLFRPPRENMPFNFKRASEWQAIFKRFNLKIIEQKKFKLFGIFPRALFVLEIPPLGH